MNNKQFLELLKKSWSLKSSTLWRENNPAAGHCGVTALLVQDHLGGDILKTRYGDIWHFYNRINGEVVDFTDSQFDELPSYDNSLSNREEAFADTNDDQFAALKEAIKQNLKKTEFT